MKARVAGVAVWAALAVMLLAGTGLCAEGEEINPQVVSTGGTQAGSAAIQVVGTVGQVSAGLGSTDELSVSSGFWRHLACCGMYAVGITGNVNCSLDGKITLSDISRLIDEVYISKAPLCCPASGNTNGGDDCKHTLSDISRLIDVVYISKAPPAGCLLECEE